MWYPEQPPRYDLADVARFVAALDDTSLFTADAPVTLARAPGRLDVMGGIADYSGSLVLELPLAAAAIVAAQPAPDAQITVRSRAAVAVGGDVEVTLPAAALADLGYAEARALLAASPRAHWAAYLLGTLVALRVEHGLPITGLRLLLESDVPPGKGVSSSAAIEVAAMRALCALHGLSLDGRELAMLCQRVENLVVGAPCGVMDQMTSALGEEDRLFALLCQPAEPQPPVALPPDVEVWGVDSGIRHAVSGADYGSVRVGAFMGYRIIAELLELPIASGRTLGQPVTVDDPLFGGYLANVTPSVWEQQLHDVVPVELRGADFLARYGGTTDPVTIVEPDRVYAVRQPAAHPIYEHHRVRLFASLLRSGPIDDERLALLGELMYQSHASYSACGLGSDGTDRLVSLVRAAGSAAGLFGAKITGGGSGGTVAVLARRGALDALRQLAARYEAETGRAVSLIGGSSPGAMAFGTLTLHARR